MMSLTNGTVAYTQSGRPSLHLFWANKHAWQRKEGRTDLSGQS